MANFVKIGEGYEFSSSPEIGSFTLKLDTTTRLLGVRHCVLIHRFSLARLAQGGFSVYSVQYSTVNALVEINLNKRVVPSVPGAPASETLFLVPFCKLL